MLKRCYNPNESMYYRYGGRGIAVCEEWLGVDGFQAFAHDMGEPPDIKMSLDRINGNDNYYKENCRWATRTQQNTNTVRNRMIEIDGVSRCLEEWAKLSPVSSHCIAKRLRRGWPARDAVFKGDSHSGVKRTRRRDQPPQVGVSPAYKRDGSLGLVQVEQPTATPGDPLAFVGKHERILEIDGVRKPLLVWCSETGANPNSVRARLKRGWSDKDALFTPALGIGQKRPGIRRATPQT